MWFACALLLFPGVVVVCIVDVGCVDVVHLGVTVVDVVVGAVVGCGGCTGVVCCYFHSVVAVHDRLYGVGVNDFGRIPVGVSVGNVVVAVAVAVTLVVGNCAVVVVGRIVIAVVVAVVCSCFVVVVVVFVAAAIIRVVVVSAIHCRVTC